MFVFAVFGVPAVSYAAGSGAISQGYATSSKNITAGTLVSLVTGSKNNIQPASVSNATRLVGIAGSKPLVELSGTGDNIQVVISGSTEALVSNINGTVSVGDKITASPVAGIGMKATSATELVGTAEANLSSVKTVTKTIAGSNGHSISIKIGLVPLTVNVAYYSGSASGTASSLVPPFVQSLANSIVGHQVSPLRVLIGLFSLLFGFIIAAVMLWVAIKSDITAIGRNPLASSSLRKGLVDVIIAAMGVLVATIVIVYIVLS
jgi:hypothetical protein